MGYGRRKELWVQEGGRNYGFTKEEGIMGSRRRKELWVQEGGRNYGFKKNKGFMCREGRAVKGKVSSVQCPVSNIRICSVLYSITI